MMSSSEPSDAPEIGQKRLEKLLQVLSKKGFTQNQVAQRVGVPASYLTDVKRGHRGMSELFARRLAAEFRLDFRWLLGTAGTMDSLELGQEVVEEESAHLWLPLFLHPVQGRPRGLPQWDGSCVEVCAAAAAQARAAMEPYVLRFLADDHAGRLRKNDLLLISQVEDPTAEIHVVKIGRGMYLARKTAAGSWERVAKPGPVKRAVQVTGNCLGIVWGRL